MDVISSPMAELDAELAAACCRLHQAVWPEKGSFSEGLAKWLALRRRRDDEICARHHLHRIEAGGRVVAMARSFQRVVAMGGVRRTVLALASVCSDPARRGQGLGRQVVAAAFARLDAAVPAALFQTSVPDFYRKLGARPIDGPIVDSSGGSGFWDPHAMIYPATAPWPAGAVDILGPGW